LDFSLEPTQPLGRRFHDVIEHVSSPADSVYVRVDVLRRIILDDPVYSREIDTS
jgi:hypothetical protein